MYVQSSQCDICRIEANFSPSVMFPFREDCPNIGYESQAFRMSPPSRQQYWSSLPSYNALPAPRSSLSSATKLTNLKRSPSLSNSTPPEDKQNAPGVQVEELQSPLTVARTYIERYLQAHRNKNGSIDREYYERPLSIKMSQEEWRKLKTVLPPLELRPR